MILVMARASTRYWASAVAAETIVEGSRRLSIRPGRANGRLFVVMAGAGFDAWVLRELLRVVVETASEGRAQIEELFEERRGPADPLDGVWWLRPKPTSSRVAGFCQNVVRYAVWQEDLTPDAFVERTDESTKLRELALLLTVSHADLWAPEEYLAAPTTVWTQPSFIALRRALSRAK